MTPTELRAIERYATARIEACAAQSDLDGYHPDGPSDYEREFVAETRRAVEAAYKALPLAYAFMLAEIAAENEAAAEAAYHAAKAFPPSKPDALRFCQYA